MPAYTAKGRKPRSVSLSDGTWNRVRQWARERSAATGQTVTASDVIEALVGGTLTPPAP